MRIPVRAILFHLALLVIMVLTFLTYGDAWWMIVGATSLGFLLLESSG